MIVSFTRVARFELRDAIIYNESRRVGLGFEFNVEVKAAVEFIRLFPEAARAISKQHRRKLLRRFPHGIIYELKPKSIIVIAVMNLVRQPDYWKDRLK